MRKQAPRVTVAGKYTNRAGMYNPLNFYSILYPTIWCRRKRQGCCFFLKWQLYGTVSLSTLILALSPRTIIL